MKIFIVIGLMLGTLFAADFRGEGQLQTAGGNNLISAVYGNKDSENATVHISYKYRLYTFMGEPVGILQAQWSISSVYFESLESVKGKNLTYGICNGKEDDSCIPAAIMLKARIVDLDIQGVGKYRKRDYRYVFDAGAMKSPGLGNIFGGEYGEMSFSTPGSPNWNKTFFSGSQKDKSYYDKEMSKSIMKQKREHLFHSFNVENIVYNLGKIRHYIEKRAKDKQDAEDAKKKAEEEKLRLEKERLEAEARAREAAALEKDAKDAEAEYDRLMAVEKEANAQHVTTAQNKLRDVELKKSQKSQKAKKRRDARLAQLERDRRDRAIKEAQRQREAEIEAARERERLAKERREAQRRAASSKDVFVDSSTGLMWQDDRDARTVIKDWSDAKQYCQNLTLAGRSDWYLPDKKQLQGLYKKKSQLKNPNSDKSYWSSTASESGMYEAVYVFFGSGCNSYYTIMDAGNGVRCVRTGQ